MSSKIVSAFIAVQFIFVCLYGVSFAKEREGEVIFKVSIQAPEDSKDIKLWVPYPVSDSEQKIEDVRIDGNFSKSAVYSQKIENDRAVYAEWSKPAKERTFTFTFKAKAVERVKKDFLAVNLAQKSDMPKEINKYLQGSEFIPTDGKIKEIALNVTTGRKTILEKATAVYDWVVENTFRDPDVKGCGTGDVERILTEKGGKCVDISSVFVSVARAAGVPAREVFGLRLGKKAEEDMTGGHHCWAEFYLPGYGWVPVDPADVRKAMLAENLDLDAAKKYRDYFFGAVDEYRIVLARGEKGYTLNPKQNNAPLAYFMYPYAEVNGKALEWLAAQKELKYQITFKEK